jgi:biopolymer transport protein ExbD
VSDFEWNRDGSLIAYGVSSPRAEDDGAFARQMDDGSVRTLLKGKGNYKSFGFDEDGKQLAFLSDRADYDKDVAPYRLYYWKSGESTALEVVNATTAGVPQGRVVHDSAPRFSEDGKQLYFNTAPPPAPPAAPDAKRPINVDLWNYKDPQLQLVVSVTQKGILLWSISGLEGTLQAPKIVVERNSGADTTGEMAYNYPKLNDALGEIASRRGKGQMRPVKTYEIILQADGDIPYGTIIKVMDNLRRKLPAGAGEEPTTAAAMPGMEGEGKDQKVVEAFDPDKHYLFPDILFSSGFD